MLIFFRSKWENLSFSKKQQTFSSVYLTKLRRNMLTPIVFVLLLIGFYGCNAASTYPNFIYILVDDLGIKFYINILYIFINNIYIQQDGQMLNFIMIECKHQHWMDY